MLDYTLLIQTFFEILRKDHDAIPSSIIDRIETLFKNCFETSTFESKKKTRSKIRYQSKNLILYLEQRNRACLKYMDLILTIV